MLLGGNDPLDNKLQYHPSEVGLWGWFWVVMPYLLMGKPATWPFEYVHWQGQPYPNT